MKSDYLKIEQGNIALRIIAVIMDAVIAFFVMLGFMGLVMTPIANKAFHYSDIQADQFRYQIASHLYILYDNDSKGKMVPNSVYKIDDYSKITNKTQEMPLYQYQPDNVKEKDLIEFYKVRIKYYYCNYRTGYNIETPKGYKAQDFRAPNYKEYAKQKTYEQWQSWADKKLSSIKKIDDAKKAALNATEDFYYQKYYQEGNTSLKNIQLFIILIPFVISFSAFFIVIPLCFKNGETLGKKVMHLGLLAKDGYSVKKRQILLRQFALFLYVGLASFVIGIGLTSFATLFIAVFAYFLATFISKTKRSPFDYLAYTIVVDTQKSVWYKDEFEEISMTDEFNENMKKYRKGPVENKNIIQVGGEIVNEDIKKEIEESSEDKK